MTTHIKDGSSLPPDLFSGPSRPTEYEARWNLDGRLRKYRTPDYHWVQGYAQRTANEEGIPVEVYRLYGPDERYLNTVYPEIDRSEQARHFWDRNHKEADQDEW